MNIVCNTIIFIGYFVGEKNNDNNIVIIIIMTIRNESDDEFEK